VVLSEGVEDQILERFRAWLAAGQPVELDDAG
jgi:hypothetical protein